MDPILEQYKELEQQVLSYTPALDKTLLFKAFQFANDAHREQKRKDGSPYITHPLAVARIVADLKLDVESLADVYKRQVYAAQHGRNGPGEHRCQLL